MSPRRSLFPCRRPGCPHLTAARYCSSHEHYEQIERRRSEARRESASKRGYGARHRAWRAAVLARDPVCQECRNAPSTNADHVVPIRQGGARFDVANGRGLCGSCHSRKTASEDGGFGNPVRAA